MIIPPAIESNAMIIIGIAKSIPRQSTLCPSEIVRSSQEILALKLSTPSINGFNAIIPKANNIIAINPVNNNIPTPPFLLNIFNYKLPP